MRMRAYLSLRRQAVTQRQREAIAERGIEWDTHQPRTVAGVVRIGAELQGPRAALTELLEWFQSEGFEPIVCAAFALQPDGSWKRMRGVPVNIAAWNAVAPMRLVPNLARTDPRQPAGTWEFPTGAAIEVTEWTFGQPMPLDEEEPEQ